MIPAPDNVVADNSWKPRTAIPNSVRRWGYYPDLRKWQAGDLLLTRAEKPDWVSKQIAEIQSIGYGAAAGQWTHAAVYLGDGLMLCEAQIDPPRAYRVIISKVFEYIGTHHLLVKRSRFASTPELGWAIATAATSRLGALYDYGFILRLAAEKSFLGDEVWLKDQESKVSPGAYICSTLYATAHAYATDRSITDKTNCLCVPAHLANNTWDFDDVEFPWLKLS